MVTDAKRDGASMGLPEAVLDIIDILLDEVTRAAWQDATELKRAAAKRPRRRKATK
jgi:hypothetical protein